VLIVHCDSQILSGLGYVQGMQMRSEDVGTRREGQGP
jgi:hypothetical protein